MQFFSDHSIKDWTSVSDSSKPTLASIGKLTVISSANLTRRFLSVLTALISLVKIENKTGPRTVPWGTPLFIETYSVLYLSTTTLCFLWSKKLISQLIIYGLMLTCFNLLQRILCDTESKALLKTREKILTKSALPSSHFNHVCWHLINAL